MSKEFRFYWCDKHGDFPVRVWCPKCRPDPLSAEKDAEIERLEGETARLANALDTERAEIGRLEGVIFDCLHLENRRQPDPDEIAPLFREYDRISMKREGR